MGLFTANKEMRQLPLNSSDLMFFRPPGNASVDVTSEVALGIPALFRAVLLISDTIASLPYRVVEVDDAENKRVVRNHPIFNLIRYEPSPWYSTFGFFQTLLIHASTVGNGLAMIIRNGNGFPAELRIIDPGLVTIKIVEGDLYYVVSGIENMVPAKDMIHVKSLSWNGINGMDVLWTHRHIIGQALANDNLMTEFYKNGAFLSGILKHPQRLTQEKVDAYTRSFKQAFGGAAKSGGVPVLHGGMEFQQLQLSPVQAGSHDSKNLSIKDIGRIYGIPGFMLGDMASATLNNFEQGVLLFKQLTLLPRVVDLQYELSRKLFPEAQKWRYQIDIDLDALTLADLKSRTDMIQTLWNTGTATTNELRKQMNLEPIDNGDQRMVPLNMVDADAPREAEARSLNDLLNGKEVLRN